MAVTLYPMLKSYLEPGARVKKLVSADIDFHEVLPDLGLVYVEDKGDHFSWLMENRRIELRLNFDEIRILSMKFLRDKIDRNADVEEIEHGIYSVCGLETLESSVIFAADKISKFGFDPNRHLVSIPNREYFLYCDKEDGGAVYRMKRLAMEIYDESRGARRLTTRLIQIEGDHSLHYV